MANGIVLVFFLNSGDYSNMSRFLNRILGIKVELQNRLFAYFMKTLSVVIQQEKRNGHWDEGILGKSLLFVKTCYYHVSLSLSLPGCSKRR